MSPAVWDVLHPPSDPHDPLPFSLLSLDPPTASSKTATLDAIMNPHAYNHLQFNQNAFPNANAAQNANSEPGNAFFQQYFLSVMQDIFYVLTDTDHKSGFKLQSVLLARMFQLVETGKITVPLFDPAAVSNSQMNNSLFLREYTANLLKAAFPHVQT